MFQKEYAVSTWESKDHSGSILFFTSARLIILKNRYLAASNIAPKLILAVPILVLLLAGSLGFLSEWRVNGSLWDGFFGFYLLGFIGFVLALFPNGFFMFLIILIAGWKAQKTITGYSGVTIESLLSLKHEELIYSQIEKVELKKKKVKFLYMVPGEGRMQKQFRINSKMHQHDLDLLNSVLPGKVTER